MKRELCALLFLLVLFGAAGWNIRRADRLTQELEQHLALSQKALLSGDRAYAETELEAAVRIWENAKHYTHVFLRHSEIDSVSDAFFQLLQGVRAGDGKELSAAYDLMRYHLDAIAYMEHISPGSVF